MKREPPLKIVPPGDDVCPVPAPVDETPPIDSYCDLVLTGGVASGVVYPWAVVELARAYRFRNIGGTSVGAMAAALAAAAEYGRRTGAEAPFEPLRRMPASLGETLPDGRTRMLSLFQPLPAGRRLIELWGRIFCGKTLPDSSKRLARCCRVCDAIGTVFSRLRRFIRRSREPVADSPAAGAAEVKSPGQSPSHMVCAVLDVYASPLQVGALLGVWLALVLGICTHGLAAVLFALLGALGGLGIALWGDIKKGVIDNDLGLCKGGTLEPQDPDPHKARPALCEWLHEGIQRSAGLAVTDRPLTFRDLWSAPAYPGAQPRPCTDADPVNRRAINLQMITTNVTHGRPYRLPLADETSRLFYLPADLAPYLPEGVLAALVAASPPYVRCDNADPDPDPQTANFLQLPGADLPVLVAARLSLSFPLLFAAVPLYAIDYENPKRSGRGLKRCLFTDGGVSSNFPIHLFDAALPRWPTFGLWLDRRSAYDYRPPADPEAEAEPPSDRVRDARSNEDVWLPDFHRQGWGDNWNRFDPRATADIDRNTAPLADPRGAKARVPLFGFLLALLDSGLDWSDRSSFRLPHVRNRVARLLLFGNEGGLHIGMPRDQILDMAHRYGTKAGRMFVARYTDEGGEPSTAWREQRWVRLQLLIVGLRERLAGLAGSAGYASHGLPMAEAIARAEIDPPLRERDNSSLLKPEQADSLLDLLGELERLEGLLTAAVAQGYKPTPMPELRLCAPL